MCERFSSYLETEMSLRWWLPAESGESSIPPLLAPPSSDHPSSVGLNTTKRTNNTVLQAIQYFFVLFFSFFFIFLTRNIFVFFLSSNFSLSLYFSPFTISLKIFFCNKFLLLFMFFCLISCWLLSLFRYGVVQAIWRRCLSKKVKQTQEPAAYLAFRQRGESRKRNLYNGSIGNPGTPTCI